MSLQVGRGRRGKMRERGYGSFAGSAKHARTFPDISISTNITGQTRRREDGFVEKYGAVERSTT